MASPSREAKNTIASSHAVPSMMKIAAKSAEVQPTEAPFGMKTGRKLTKKTPTLGLSRFVPSPET